MFMDSLHRRKAEIEQAANAFGARRIRVFGSVSRGGGNGRQRYRFPGRFPAGYDLFTQRLPLMEKLAELTGRQVDIIPEHELSHLIRDRVLCETREL
jgi:predicted nucleotidyltransferase